MKRRVFLKSVSTLAVLAATAPGAWAKGLVPPFARTPRIAVGGIASECSTYSRIRSTLDTIEVVRGQALLDDERFAFLKRYDVPFLPTLVAQAGSGGPMQRAAYEALKAEYLDRLRAFLPLDGVYLSMHGALFVEDMEDAEGDWYAATRAVVGPDCILSASYDLHGNLSQRIVDNLDAFTAYRTAPHVDRVENWMRATDMLTHCLRYGLRPSIVWASVPVLLAGEQSSTEWQPGRRLWSDLSEFNRLDGILDVSQLVGYVWADEPRSAASVVVTGFRPAAQKAIASELAQRYWDARHEFRFGSPTGTIEETLAQAMAATTHPVVISDSGDNPGGGGNADQTFFLEALLKAGASNVLLGGMTDQPATDACYAAGVGATIPLSIGATLDPVMCNPVKVAAAKVVYLAPATTPAERTAVVTFAGITATLASTRRNFHAAEAFRELHVEPTDFKIVVLKCGYLNPTMKPLANPHLMALSPGAIDQDIPHITNTRRGRKFPWADDFAYRPEPYLSARAGRVEA
ncbi:M81 family metallopeptidase [Novosphingobium sp. 1949]|uniref:M81 family metallopeptidase n=1 Tax=Novosphingobium organovorum TaxID=2930092 RepID=A0ABT0BD36_9SPHN|nr:M81 family metallopeptidase [Novosphingobium organovorum]MCJ2182959.1 M81 family metallopeptidase [Novosphingobium organovorum]